MNNLIVLTLLITCVFFIDKYVSQRVRKKFTKGKYNYLNTRQINVHMISETEFATKGQGVHTAYVEMMQLLKGIENLSPVKNGDGHGNVYHSHTYGPYYFWKGLGYKGRRILTAHVIPSSSKGAIPFWKFLMPLTQKYLKLAYSYADVIVAISPAVEQEILDLGVKTKIVRIYNPVIKDNWLRTVERRKEGRAYLNIDTDQKLVLGVGQLQERKGVEDFIDIARALPNYRFVWVGGRPMGLFTEGISRINKRIELAPDNLYFTGLIDLAEMAKMYAAADVFLFPSYQENCPLAPLEAAASGLPVVFRDIPEYRKLFHGEYLKGTTTGDFINLTKALLTSPTFFSKSLTLSRELIREFDQVKIKNQLIELYHATLRDYYGIKSNKISTVDLLHKNVLEVIQ